MSNTVYLQTSIVRRAAVEKVIEPYTVPWVLPAKSTINIPDDQLSGLYYIREGRTRHYMTSSTGVEKILYFLTPGWLFGETSFIMNRGTTGLYSFSETDVVIWKISPENVRLLLNQSPDFQQLVYECLAFKVMYLREELENVCFNTCKERLIRTLFISADDSVVVDGEWYNMKIQYTHYDLGVQIGSVRVTVSKLLNELCNEGIIRILNRKIQVNVKEHARYMRRWT